MKLIFFKNLVKISTNIGNSQKNVCWPIQSKNDININVFNMHNVAILVILGLIIDL